MVRSEDDQMWPGTEMAAALMRRSAEAGRRGDRHRSFADAGHIIRPPIMPTTITWTEGLYSGGTPEGRARANQEAWAEILRFLGEHLACRRPRMSPVDRQQLEWPYRSMSHTVKYLSRQAAPLSAHSAATSLKELA
jgi:hypothetical protein